MASLNDCRFIGRIGRDPEARFTSSGQPVASFSIAVDESYKDKDGQKVEQTEWINCVAWGKTAEFITNWLSKGRRVYVAGKWKTEKYKDKDGNDRTAVKLTVQTIQGLDKNPEGMGGAQPQGQPYSANDDPLMDDAPF